MKAIVSHPIAGAFLGLAACAGMACSGGARGGRAGAAQPSAGAPGATRSGAGGALVQSNVTRKDYAGSEACVPCHADEAAAWAASPMHRMTRDARGADVRAPFDGTRWRFKDDVVVLERQGEDRVVRIEPAAGPSHAYRVTRVIGGRTREDFAGVEIGGATVSIADEVVLPVSYLLSDKQLRYKGYSVMVHERSTLRAGPAWSRTCIFCHNTVPEMDRLVGALAGPRAPHYQGEQVDAWLPDDRRAHARVADAAAFSGAARSEITRLGGADPGGSGDPQAIARRTADVIRAGFDGGALIEVGIGCEACHGGALEHARDPRVHPSLTPLAPWLDVEMPGPDVAGRAVANDAIASGAGANGAQAINRACARCHQVLFSRYPFTWEGGRRDATAGGSHINSGEGRDFLLGGCSRSMACTACHDPHGADSPEKLRALATPAGNATCTGCHRELAGRDALAAHAHHDPSGAGASCVACHMPRKNMGLGGALTRYHRIGSPTDPARVLGDRPLECALCHADRSVAKLVDTMEKWWPVRYPRQRLEEMYGSLDANVMRATLERGKPHEQAVAAAVLGEAHDRAAAPLVARLLVGEYPLVREWAKRALIAMLGRCDVDLTRDDAAIARAAAACAMGALPSPPAPATARDEDPED
jgi:predicted CXXCH cytochrome family protein